MRKLVMLFVVFFMFFFTDCKKEDDRFIYQFTTSVHVTDYFYIDEWYIFNSTVVLLKDNESDNYFIKYKTDMCKIYKVSRYEIEIKYEMKKLPDL